MDKLSIEVINSVVQECKDKMKNASDDKRKTFEKIANKLNEIVKEAVES